MAQVALFATAPVLARLYSPAAFGVLAILLTISTLASSVGGLCYEVAVILPRSKRMAAALFSLALSLSIATAVATACIVATIQAVFPAAFGDKLDNTFLIACVVATLFTTQFNVLCYAHSRAAQYGNIAIAKFNQSLFPSLLQILFGVMGFGMAGLLWGRALGVFATVVALIRKLPPGFRPRDVLHTRLASMKAAAKHYRDFLLQVPRQLLVRGANSLPATLILIAYGAAPAGLFFFASRLVERPGTVLGDALSRVPMKQFADRKKRGAPVTRAALLYTMLVGAPVMVGVVTLAVISRPLFHIAFGSAWEPAADYAVILAGWSGIRIASLPMATLTTVFRIQGLNLFLDAAFAPRVLIIPLMAHMGYDALAAVAAFCVVSVVYHAAVFAVGLFAALRYDRELGERRSPTAFAVAAD